MPGINIIKSNEAVKNRIINIIKEAQGNKKKTKQKTIDERPR